MAMKSGFNHGYRESGVASWGYLPCHDTNAVGFFTIEIVAPSGKLTVRY